MARKPEWKAEFDEQTAEVALKLVELMEEYPREAVLEAMDDLLREETREEWRDRYEEGHS